MPRFNPFRLTTLIRDLSAATQNNSAGGATSTQQQQDPSPAALTPQRSATSLFARSTVLGGGHGHAGGGQDSVPGSPSLGGGRAATIEAVELCDANLYVGTSDGHVLHFMLDRSTTQAESGTKHQYESLHSEHLSRSSLGLGRKPVSSILAVPTESRMVAFCDGTVVFLELDTLEQLPVVMCQPIKQVTCFCADRQVQSPMPLAFVNSRRRMLLCGHLGDMFEPEKELPIPEGAATMVRYDSRICAADGEQYKLIFLDNGSMIPLFPYDRSLQNPVVAVFGEGEFVLVTATPQGLGLGVFISQNGEPVRGTLEWTAIPKSLAFHFPYVAALLNNNTIEIHNVMTQQRVQSLTLPPNVDSRFLAEATFNLDVNTTGGSSTSSGGTIRILIGCKNCVLALTMTPLASQVDQLLEQRDVERALELAEHMMLAQPDESALRKKTQMEHLYRRAALLHFQDTLFDEALGLLKKGATDPAFLTSWFPDIADHTEGLDVDMSEKHPEYPATSDAIVNAYLSKEYADADPETLTSFGEALFGNAQSMLGEYLRYARTIYPVDDPRQEHIDMTLLKLYIKTDPARLASFLSSPTRCRMADAEALLEAQKRYYDLSLLHKTRGMNENVLDMWHRLAVGEIEDPAFPGLETVCEYVKALEHRDIVMSAVEWVLRLDRGLAIGILVHHMDKTMSMGDIEAYLKEREPEAYVEFVERLVFGREEQDPNLHTTLALLYLTTLQSLATPSSLTSLDTAYLSLPTRPTYRSFLLSRPSDRLCVERAKLLNFLDTSAHIDYGVVAERVEAVEGLKAERAVVMTKQGGDKDAEAVVKLWLEVGDDVSAEACAVAQPVPETRGRLLRVLLEHCMRDEGGDPQQHMKAIGLLNRHATHFDLLSILPALPTTWSLRLLAPHFIASALRSSVHAHRTSVITKNVAKGMHLKTHAVLLDERQARVAVHLPEGGVRCCVCEKGVTDPTVFARWEDGRVTHVHCVGRGESTR